MKHASTPGAVAATLGLGGACLLFLAAWGITLLLFPSGHPRVADYVGGIGFLVAAVLSPPGCVFGLMAWRSRAGTPLTRRLGAAGAALNLAFVLLILIVLLKSAP